MSYLPILILITLIRKAEMMNRENLLEDLNLIKSCLATTSDIEAYQKFCFVGDAVIAFNSFQAACTYSDFGVEGLIEGKLLIDLLKSYKITEFDFVTKKDNVFLDFGKGKKSKLVLTDVKNFKFDEPTKGELEQTAFVGLTEDFLTGLKYVLISANKNGDFPVNRGVTLKENTLYSSDSESRASRYKLSDVTIGDREILLPLNFCELIISFSKKFNGQPIMHLAEDYIYVSFDGGFVYTLFPREIMFLPFDNFFEKADADKESATYAVVEEMINIFKRHLVIGNLTTINIVNGTASFVTESHLGTVTDEVMDFPFNIDQDFKMNIEHLLTAIQVVDDFKFISTDSSVLFVGIKGNFVHIIDDWRV